MEDRHGQLADRGVRPLCVVPLDEPVAAALDWDRALLHIVHYFERQAVDLVAQHILDDLREMLVLLIPRRDLRRRDRAVHLGLDQLGDDVPDVDGLRLPLAHDDIPELPVALIELLAVIHLRQLVAVRRLVRGQALLPQCQLVVVLLHFCGFPHFSISINRSAFDAAL